jgi:hypothetical protein
MILKNAGVLPPEAELLKEIYTLEDLLRHVGDETDRRAMAKSIHYKMIRLDLLRRRPLSLDKTRYYSRKVALKFARR